MPFYPIFPSTCWKARRLSVISILFPPIVNVNINWNFFLTLSPPCVEMPHKICYGSTAVFWVFSRSIPYYSVRQTDECSEWVFMRSVVCRLLKRPLPHHEPLFGNSTAILYYLWHAHAWCQEITALVIKTSLRYIKLMYFYAVVMNWSCRSTINSLYPSIEMHVFCQPWYGLCPEGSKPIPHG